jgi:hypothetical protein
MGWDTAFERLRAKLDTRAKAYQALFIRPGGDLAPVAEIVMRDLSHYCYAKKPTLKFNAQNQCDPIAMAFAEGRRDVWNRITAMCNLTDEQINRIANHRTNEDE